MLPKEERDAIQETIDQAIRQAVPNALVGAAKDGTVAYKVAKGEEDVVFCILQVFDDRLELRFPKCPDLGEIEDRVFETDAANGGCRLVLRKRLDIPGKLLHPALESAAEAASSS